MALFCSHIESSSCANLAAEPPVGYRNNFPSCWYHLTSEDALKYSEEVRELTSKYPDVRCPVCLENLQNIGSEKLFKMSCCKNFICRECVKTVSMGAKCYCCNRDILESDIPERWLMPRNIDSRLDITEILNNRVKIYRDVEFLRNALETLNRFPTVISAIENEISRNITQILSPIAFSISFPAFLQEELDLPIPINFREIEFKADTSENKSDQWDDSE